MAAIILQRSGRSVSDAMPPEPAKRVATPPNQNVSRCHLVASLFLASFR